MNRVLQPILITDYNVQRTLKQVKCTIQTKVKKMLLKASLDVLILMTNQKQWHRKCNTSGNLYNKVYYFEFEYDRVTLPWYLYLVYANFARVANSWMHFLSKHMKIVSRRSFDNVRKSIYAKIHRNRDEDPKYIDVLYEIISKSIVGKEKNT